MSKPTTNTDGKNAKHTVKVLQTKGFSKEGAAEIADGNPPTGAADRSRAQGSKDMGSKDSGAQAAAGAKTAARVQSNAEKRLADHYNEIAKNLR